MDPHVEKEFDPTGKGHLLALHILLKGFQAGALIGTLVVTPIMAYRLRSRPREIIQNLPNAFAISALSGIALAGGACAAVQQYCEHSAVLISSEWGVVNQSGA